MLFVIALLNINANHVTTRNETGTPAKTNPLARLIAFVVSCWKCLWYNLWKVDEMA